MAVLHECVRCGAWVPVTYEWKDTSPLCLGCWFANVGFAIKSNKVPARLLYVLGLMADNVTGETNAEGTS